MKSFKKFVKPLGCDFKKRFCPNVLFHKKQNKEGKNEEEKFCPELNPTKPNPSTYILDLKAWEKRMSTGHFSAAAAQHHIFLFVYSRLASPKAEKEKV